MSRSSAINDFSDIHAAPKGPADALAMVMDMVADEVYGRRLSEPELVVVCSGEVKVDTLEERWRSVAAGSFILLLPGSFASLVAVTDSTVFIGRLRSEKQLYDVLEFAKLDSFRPDEVSGPAVLPVSSCMQVYLDGFLPLLREGFSSRRYHEAKIAEFLYILRECYNKTELAALFAPLLGPEIRFKNFVFSTIRHVGSVVELAGIANMSPTGFRSKFRRIMGQSPSEMITRFKADMVKHDLLNTDIPLKEISEKYGFNSIHVFTRFCTRHLGLSPGNLRKTREANL